MNIAIRFISILFLSLSLIACGDTPQDKADKAEDALASMNAMNSEINGYNVTNLSSKTLDELNNMERRTKKYIGHADKAIRNINDEDVYYFGDEDVIYKNRRLAQSLLDRIRIQKDRLNNPQYQEELSLENIKQSNFKALDNEMMAFADFEDDVERIQRKTQLRDLNNSEDYLRSLTSMTTSELINERDAMIELNSFTNNMIDHVHKMAQNPHWDEYVNQLGNYEVTQGLNTVLNSSKDPLQPIIDHINTLIAG